MNEFVDPLEEMRDSTQAENTEPETEPFQEQGEQEPPAYESEDQTLFEGSPTTPISPEENADMILAMGDVLQAQSFGLWLKAKRHKLVKGNKEAIEKVRIKFEKEKVLELDTEEARLYDRFEKMNQLLDRLHISDDEKSRIRPALVAYCKRHNIQMPVDWALWFTVGDVLMERVEKIAQV